MAHIITVRRWELATIKAAISYRLTTDPTLTAPDRQELANIRDQITYALESRQLELNINGETWNDED